jgi:hypothetical protein
MIKFPHVTLPDRFTRLLALDFSSSPQSQRDLEIYIRNEKELYFLVLQLFRDVDPEGSLEKIISVAGWTAIRNRLCSAYLEQASSGRFPDKANLVNINELIYIENNLREYSVSGYSRAFMLGLYAKSTLNYLNSHTGDLVHGPLILKPEHFELVEKSQSKRVRIDWLMLIIILLEHYMGFARINSLLSSGSTLNSLIALLDDEEKSEFLNNLINYASSINDSEIFTNQNLAEI